MAAPGCCVQIAVGVLWSAIPILAATGTFGRRARTLVDRPGLLVMWLIAHTIWHCCVPMWRDWPAHGRAVPESVQRRRQLRTRFVVWFVVTVVWGWGVLGLVIGMNLLGTTWP